MDAEFVLKFETLQANSKLNIKIEMIGADGKSVSATKTVQFCKPNEPACDENSFKLKFTFWLHPYYTHFQEG